MSSMMQTVEADIEGRKNAIELHFSPYLRGCIKALAAIAGVSVENWIEKVL
ncbi:MAG: hypothetical protein KAV87_35855 [Desulfobacteraceae bacterium]|nr:hypothetical protein [Desulfobacteraceae bacterium]